jgi:hypothetical protein
VINEIKVPAPAIVALRRWILSVNAKLLHKVVGRLTKKVLLTNSIRKKLAQQVLAAAKLHTSAALLTNSLRKKLVKLAPRVGKIAVAAAKTNRSEIGKY